MDDAGGLTTKKTDLTEVAIGAIHSYDTDVDVIEFAGSYYRYQI
jgi:hypothetical protein